MASGLPPLSALDTMKLPLDLVARMKAMAGMQGLFDNEIDGSMLPLDEELMRRQATQAQTQGALTDAQNAPPPSIDPIAGLQNNAFGNLAESLAPGRGFKEAAQQRDKQELAGMNQRRMERLKTLEGASEHAAARAESLGDILLQAKHLKEAEKWANLRKELIGTAGNYYDNKDKHANKLEELKQDFDYRTRVEGLRHSNEMKVKYGDEAGYTPQIREQIKDLRSVRDAEIKVIQESVKDLGFATDADAKIATAQRRIQQIHEKYNAAYSKVVGGEGAPIAQGMKPEEIILDNMRDAVRLGITTVRGWNNAIHSKKSTQEFKDLGIPIGNFSAQGRKYFGRLESLKVRATQLAKVVTKDSSMDFATRTLLPHAARAGQELEQINKELMELYGLTLTDLDVDLQPKDKGIEVKGRMGIQ